MRIAINGIGIARPTLAFWLLKSGHEVLLVEQAPQLRSGGYVIDFWGIGFDIAEKMGLISQLKELGYQVQEVRLVDDRGYKSGGFSADVFNRMTSGRFTSLRRSDLSAVIYGAIAGQVETLFGDSIAGIKETGDRLHISFERATSRNVDLVIGADGLHSRIRNLIFGPEAQFEITLGYYVAAFEIAGYRPRNELVYVSHEVPGRQVSRFSMRDDKTLFLFVFHERYLTEKTLTTDDGRRAVLRNIFNDVGWECPQILDAMENVSNIYFDRVSQIRMNRWTKGRTALIGDAAACVSLLAGEGTGLAMAEAYVLAGEIHRCHGEHATAFVRYQSLLMPFLEQKQRSAAKFASAFAPQTAFGIRIRNLVTQLLWIPLIADFIIGRDLRDNIQLPNYGL